MEPAAGSEDSTRPTNESSPPFESGTELAQERLSSRTEKPMTSFACLLLALSADAAPETFGQLAQPRASLHYDVQGPLTDYRPAVGDILLSTSKLLRTKIIYRLALVGVPSHAGVVVRMPDGRLGVFEAGGGGEHHTRTTSLEDRFYRGKDKAIWVRKPKTPLTAEQETRLSEYAALNEGKGFTRWRAIELMPLVPTGPRGPIRTFFLGKPVGFREEYFCTENVLEGLVYAGKLDGETIRPTATSPRDLQLDRSTNLYIRLHPPLACGWYPPALWIGCEQTPACRVKPEPKRGLLRFGR